MAFQPAWPGSHPAARGAHVPRVACRRPAWEVLVRSGKGLVPLGKGLVLSGKALVLSGKGLVLSGKGLVLSGTGSWPGCCAGDRSHPGWARTTVPPAPNAGRGWTAPGPVAGWEGPRTRLPPACQRTGQVPFCRPCRRTEARSRQGPYRLRPSRPIGAPDRPGLPSSPLPAPATSGKATSPLIEAKLAQPA